MRKLSLAETWLFYDKEIEPAEHVDCDALWNKAHRPHEIATDRIMASWTKVKKIKGWTFTT